MAQNEQENHDSEDVPEALKQETADGSGFVSEDELPEGDFVSFSEDDVENTHDGDNVGDEDEVVQ